MRNPEVLSAWFDYLMSLNVGNVDFTETRPNSNFYNEMVEASISNTIKFVEYLITELSKDCKDALKVPQVLKSCGELFKLYNKWKEQSRVKDDYNLYSFGRSLNDIQGITKKRKEEGIYYMVDCSEIIGYFKANRLFGYEPDQRQNFIKKHMAEYKAILKENNDMKQRLSHMKEIFNKLPEKWPTSHK